MATLPSLAIFRCEGCGKQLTSDEKMAAHIFPWKRRLEIEPDGTCSACRGDSWTLSVLYVQRSTELGPTVAGLGMAAVTGVGFTQSSTASSQMTFAQIPASVVAEFNEEPSSRMTRIGEFVSSRERQRAIREGAKECLTCGMLFVPVADKTWTAQGFCSKSCFAQGERAGSGGTALESNQMESHARPRITVRCEAGHEFEILVSFRGMLRPCPQCGIKTRVPDQG